MMLSMTIFLRQHLLHQFAEDAYPSQYHTIIESLNLNNLIYSIDQVKMNYELGVIGKVIPFPTDHLL